MKATFTISQQSDNNFIATIIYNGVQKQVIASPDYKIKQTGKAGTFFIKLQDLFPEFPEFTKKFLCTPLFSGEFDIQGRMIDPNNPTKIIAKTSTITIYDVADEKDLKKLNDLDDAKNTLIEKYKSVIAEKLSQKIKEREEQVKLQKQNVLKSYDIETLRAALLEKENLMK